MTNDNNFRHEIGDTVRYTPDGHIVLFEGVVSDRGRFRSGRNWYKLQGKDRICHESQVWQTREKILGLT